MTKLALVVAALIPVAATGAPGSSDSSEQKMQQSSSQQSSQLKVEKQKLQRAVPATAMLDTEVFTEDGKEVGNVSDVLVSSDGKVKNFLVETNDIENASEQPDEQQRSAQQQRTSGESDWEQTQASVERTAESAGNTAESALQGDRELKLDPKDVKYDDKQGRVTVSMQKLKNAEPQTYQNQPQQEVQLSELVGMEVALQDDNSFGRVEDVMLSKDNTEVVALVVDNWDGLEKHRRALPMKQAQIDAEAGEVSFQVSESDVKQLPDFDLGNYKQDSGWDLTEWTQ